MREFFDNLLSSFTDGALFSDPINTLLPYYTWLTRLLLPALAIVVVVRCALSLLRAKQDKETWAWLGLGDGVRLPVNHWENIIGRGTGADISLPFLEISRTHAALIRNELGLWQLTDIAKKENILLNGELVEGSVPVKEGDIIELAGNKLFFANITAAEDEEQRSRRAVPGKKIRPSRTLGWLSLFILVLASQLAMAQFESGHSLQILLGFGWLLALVWGSFIFSRTLRRTGFEIETMAFFLTCLGLAVIASGEPTEMLKQCMAVTMGVVGFFVLGLILRDMKIVKALRWAVAGLAFALMAYVLIFGEVRYGAQNWITIFGFSLQPSELVKVLFIFAGAATLDRLFARRNLYAFIVLSAVIVGSLALMSDFGTAVIFFVTYLIIAFLRSGDLATIGLSIGGAVSAVVLVLTAKPYVAERFATWGHAWEFAATGGYQQTRAMTVMSSGGLFGMGGGQGWLKQVAASDTDLVFAFVCEEWGLIIGVLALLALVIIAFFAVRSSGNARSSYYVIAACGTAALLLFQTILNVGGSLDLLPLTGVTFPFVSNGGTSMIACWCLMAFLKAADTRQNASFAISLPSRRKMRKQEASAEQEQELLPLDQLFDPSSEDTTQIPTIASPSLPPEDFSFPPIQLDREGISSEPPVAASSQRLAPQPTQLDREGVSSALPVKNISERVSSTEPAELRSTDAAAKEQLAAAEQAQLKARALALMQEEAARAARSARPAVEQTPAAAEQEDESPFARPFPTINFKGVKPPHE